MKFKYKTRVYVPAGNNKKEPATVDRIYKHMLPLPAGYIPIKFADGSRVLVHESHIHAA